ncbi:S-layer protein [Natrarchaeobius oligotrophus]|uniref:S-layer protein n=1 Tax=Natrarchaeobius chitinivorans TaxID=1679083 RepID=A0A3N6N1H5_NATCH|nr:S-layer protein [Natrarchaeobius chitinivorans]
MRQSVDRRTFSIGIATLAGVSLAGCLDEGESDADPADDGGEPADDPTDDTDDADDDSADDLEEPEDEPEDEPEAETNLTAYLENEDGDPVSDGVTVEFRGDGVTYIVEGDIQDGVAEPAEGIEPGEYVVVAEGDEFETVEEEASVDEGDQEEVTLVLEGAPGDEPEEEDDE